MCDYECPKCKKEYNAIGNHEDDSGEHVCDVCGFEFIVDIEYDPSYDAKCKTCEFGDVQYLGSGHHGKRCKHCYKVNHESLTTVKGD